MLSRLTDLQHEFTHLHIQMVNLAEDNSKFIHRSQKNIIFLKMKKKIGQNWDFDHSDVAGTYNIE